MNYFIVRLVSITRIPKSRVSKLKLLQILTYYHIFSVNTRRVDGTFFDNCFIDF